MVCKKNSSNAVSRAILKPVYRFGIPNSNPQTLKSVDLWCKLSSTFFVAKPRERCFELFRTENRQKFSRFSPLDPTEEGLERLPRLPSCSTVFLLATLLEKPAPPKNCWIRHCIQNIYFYVPSIDDPSGIFLKIGATLLTTLITELYNLCISSRAFPQACRIAKIKPLFTKIFKNGSQGLPSIACIISLGEIKI